MRAGLLRQTITIQKQTASTDANFNQSVAWSTQAANVPCHMVATGGSEFYRGRRLQADTRYIAIVRYRTDVTPLMRISWGTKTLQITAVFSDEEKREWTQMDCREVDTK